MRKSTVKLLAFINMVLAAALTWMWFDAQGHLKNTHWAVPAVRPADFAGMLPKVERPQGGEVGRFMATLDRPLFSPTRRPPPPVIVTVPPPPPPPDPLNNTQLLALIVGPHSGAIVARVDGKVRRVRLNERIGDWTIQSVKDRDVTFARGNETRVVRLDRARAAAGSPLPPPVR